MTGDRRDRPAPLAERVRAHIILLCEHETGLPDRWLVVEGSSRKGAPPHFGGPLQVGNFSEQLWGDSPERVHPGASFQQQFHRASRLGVRRSPSRRCRDGRPGHRCGGQRAAPLGAGHLLLEKQLDANRPVKDFGAVTEEVLQNLVALTGADVEVTLHIRATKPDGFDDGVIRTVTENARTLKFEPGSGFSEE